MESASGSVAALLSLIIGVGVIIAWALCVRSALYNAGEKGYSRWWVMFGLHPIGAITVCIVMSALPKRTRCPRCFQYVKAAYHVCPYCQHALIPAQAVPVHASAVGM